MANKTQKGRRPRPSRTANLRPFPHRTSTAPSHDDSDSEDLSASDEDAAIDGDCGKPASGYLSKEYSLATFSDVPPHLVMTRSSAWKAACMAEQQRIRAAKRKASDEDQSTPIKPSKKKSKKDEKTQQDRMEEELLNDIPTSTSTPEQYERWRSRNAEARRPVVSSSHTSRLMPPVSRPARPLATSRQAPMIAPSEAAYQQQYESSDVDEVTEMQADEKADLQRTIHHLESQCAELQANLNTQYDAGLLRSRLLNDQKARIEELEATAAPASEATAVRSPQVALPGPSMAKLEEQNMWLKVANESLIERDMKLTQEKQLAEWKAREMEKEMALAEWDAGRIAAERAAKDAETKREIAAKDDKIAEMEAKVKKMDGRIREAFTW